MTIYKYYTFDNNKSACVFALGFPHELHIYITTNLPESLSFGEALTVPSAQEVLDLGFVCPKYV